MSSFFSSRSKSQVRISSQSNKSSNEGFGNFENRSRLSFSKMRKKRPPPINIAVAGNVIITNATPASQVIYADMPWSASNPPTPRANVCSNPGCMARDTMPMSSPVDAQFRLNSPYTTCTCQQYIQSTPSNPSYISPHHACFSAAELPGSFASPKSSVELDAPTTPTRLTFDHLDEHILDSPPNLTLSPKTEPAQSTRQDRYQFGQLLETEPTRNGRSLRQMDYDELMDILPDLTPGQVKMYWNPAIRKELEEEKQTSPAPAARSSRWSERNEVYDGGEDPEQVRAECEIRLNTKENEITGLLQIHDSRINALCKFISEHLENQLEGPENDNNQEVREIISAQQRRGRDPFDADLQHMYQSRQIQGLQDHISKLEPVAIRNEKRARAYKARAKSLQADLMASKETEQLLKQELIEKDAYIDTLNNKVTQLLTMRPDPFSPSDARGSRKHLPSPAPCDWKRAEELKHQVAT